MSIFTPLIRGVIEDSVVTNEVFGGFPVPLLFMPLVSDLSLTQGTGAATFTRSTIATFINKDSGLLETASIDAARFESEGVLIEGASTNLCLRSEEFDDAKWIKFGGAGVTTASGTAPDGTNTATRLLAGGGNPILFQTVATTALVDRTFSVYVKSNGGGFDNFAFQVDGGVSVPFTATSEWKLFQATVATDGNDQWGIRSDSGSAIDILIWGAQLEELPFASSYIRTLGTAVSRGADSLSISSAGNMPPYQDDYALSFDFSFLGLKAGNQYLLDVTSAIAFRTSRLSPTGTIVGADGPASGTVVIDNLTPNITRNLTLNREESGTRTVWYLDGSPKGTDEIIAGSAVFSEVFIGRWTTNDTQNIYGHIKNFKIFDISLTPQQVASL